MTTSIYGTVSHGTLRTEDLLRAFSSTLRQITNHPGTLTMADEADEYLASDEIREEFGLDLVNDLISLLNEHAPDGHYFGAHEGDGSDFGFWPIED